MSNISKKLLKQAGERVELLASTATPEVNPKRDRRRFTSEYKLKILNELDRSMGHGEKGAIVRREGLYSSHITEWRRQRDEGALCALNKVRGRKTKYDSKDNRISELEKVIAKLESKLTQAEAIIDVQKKVSEIFGITNQITKNNEGKS